MADKVYVVVQMRYDSVAVKGVYSSFKMAKQRISKLFTACKKECDAINKDKDINSTIDLETGEEVCDNIFDCKWTNEMQTKFDETVNGDFEHRTVTRIIVLKVDCDIDIKGTVAHTN